LTVAILWCFAASLAVAEKTESFPGNLVDSRTYRIQEKVDQLFEQREYERALFIYENELAPLGDKYAQYMVGYMYLTGTGVAEDPVVASAWYRLAAERSNSLFVAVRDQLVSDLSDFDKGRSDELYLRLRQEHSDVVILMRLVREDVNAVAVRTGSRIPGRGGPVTILDPRVGFGVSGDEYFRQVQKRYQARVEYLVRELDSSGLNLNVNDLDIDTLEDLVQRHVSTVDDTRSFSVDR